MQLHEGNYLDPVMRDIESFLKSSQINVSGDVYLTLSPYRYTLNKTWLVCIFVESKSFLVH